LVGDLGAEVSACEHAVELAPDSVDAWSRLAHALARTDRMSACLDACARALELGADGEVVELRERMSAADRRELPAA
jgi:predicted TPR repeat methyltransferase